MKLKNDPHPAPLPKPLPSFGGTMADRLNRSTTAARVMQEITKAKMQGRIMDTDGIVWPSWEALGSHVMRLNQPNA